MYALIIPEPNTVFMLALLKKRFVQTALLHGLYGHAYKKNRLQPRAYKIVGFALTEYRIPTALGRFSLKRPAHKSEFSVF